MYRALTLIGCFVVAATFLCNQPAIRGSNSSNAVAVRLAVNAATWNPQSAATYLDQRAGWWMSWPKAQRDHETFCISCHTAVPYAMSRATLRPALAESTESPNERRLLDNVTKRVRLWREVAPFYSDADRGVYKSVESRGTESVLNALVLASHDAQTGHLSDDTRTAFANMWAEQQTSAYNLPTAKASAASDYSTPSSTSTAATSAANPAPDQLGAWRWLRFKNEPWEADDSDFYGATLAAIATGMAPENYRAHPEIQSNLKLLREYLNHQASAEPIMNRVVLLWASTKLPGLLDSAEQESIVKEILARQQPDGGWSLPSLAGDWKRHDNTPQNEQSDGYATGLIAFTLEQLRAAAHGTAKDPATPSRFDGEALPHTPSAVALANLNAQASAPLQSALTWLSAHQDPSTGFWPSASLNNNDAHHISPDTVRFMNDAATSYAVLALTSASSR